MKNLLNLDSPFIQFLMDVADLMILNLTYLVFCIPIVTIGAATAALYRVMLNYAKDETANPIRQFWRAFCENLKPATILFLIMLIPMACLLYYIMAIVSAVYSGSMAMFLLICIAALLIMMIWSFLWPMQAQFENNIGNTLKNSILLSVGHFPRAILMSVINFFPLMLMLLLPELFIRAFMLWVLLGFSVSAKINTKLVLKVFAPFLQTTDTQNSEMMDE